MNKRKKLQPPLYARFHRLFVAVRFALIMVVCHNYSLLIFNY